MLSASPVLFHSALFFFPPLPSLHLRPSQIDTKSPGSLRMRKPCWRSTLLPPWLQCLLPKTTAAWCSGGYLGQCFAVTALSEICRGKKRGSGRHLFTCLEQIAYITVYVSRIGPAHAYCPHFSPFAQCYFSATILAVLVFRFVFLCLQHTCCRRCFPDLLLFSLICICFVKLQRLKLSWSPFGNGPSLAGMTTIDCNFHIDGTAPELYRSVLYLPQLHSF